MSGIVSQGLLKKDVYSIDGACPDVLGMSSPNHHPKLAFEPSIDNKLVGPTYQ